MAGTVHTYFKDGKVADLVTFDQVCVSPYHDVPFFAHISFNFPSAAPLCLVFTQDLLHLVCLARQLLLLNCQCQFQSIMDYEHCVQSADYIRQKAKDLKPQLALICGSGLCKLKYVLSRRVFGFRILDEACVEYLSS